MLSELSRDPAVGGQSIKVPYVPVNSFVHRNLGVLMVLKVGDKAPDFNLPTDDGQTVSLSMCKGRTVVLYFYPKDDTSGCTREAIDFSVLAEEFVDQNALVIGISRDSTTSHAKFRTKHNLRVILAADVDGAVCQAYGVWVEKSMYGRKYWGIERTTFLINPTGKIKHIWPKVKVPGHADTVLGACRVQG